MAKSIYDDLLQATAALHEITVLREQLKARAGQAAVEETDKALEAKLDAIAGAEVAGAEALAGAGEGRQDRPTSPRFARSYPGWSMRSRTPTWRPPPRRWKG